MATVLCRGHGLARETRPFAPAGVGMLATKSAAPPAHPDRRENEAASVALAQEDGHGNLP
jgi:hypothetical protein